MSKIRWGWRRSSVSTLYNSLKRLVGLRVYVIYRRPLDASIEDAELPEGHVIRRVEEADYEALAKDADTRLTQDFLRQASARGDVCIGYFDEDTLVSYFWCSFTSAPAEHGLWVGVPQNCSYAYKAYTLPNYRGRRLLERLTHANDKLLVANGFSQNVEYVEINNFAQIQASERHGNRQVGRIYMRLGRNGVAIYHSKAVKNLGFSMNEPTQP